MSSDKPRIRDLPGLQQMAEDAAAVKALELILPALRPGLELLGCDMNIVTSSISDAASVAADMEALIQVPDRFNSYFAGRGWIIYESMNFNLAASAISKAESGDVDAAEAELVAHYTPAMIRFHLQRLRRINAFMPRYRLALKALEDYEAARYHAVVPLVLALMDGLVNSVHELHRRFFAGGTDMEAWDCVAAHDTGLNQIASLFRKGRYKITQDPLTIPYRNGIMHGMDLGFDNVMVAAKCWAALFAVGDWAKKVEDGETGPPPKLQPPTLLETLEQARRLSKEAALLDAWKPRTVIVGIDITPMAKESECGQQTPERTLARWLDSWSRRNYGYMASCCFSPFRKKEPAPKEVRDLYSKVELETYRIVAVVDSAPATAEISVDLTYLLQGGKVQNRFCFEFQNILDGGPVAAGMSNAEWKLINWEEPARVVIWPED